MDQANINQLLATAQDYLGEEPSRLYRQEISQLISDIEKKNKDAALELSDRLMGQLRFGTAGLRGRIPDLVTSGEYERKSVDTSS